ncbi:MAG TPA: T9SS type A sorting domain-containing protein [Ignavibacteria bacterium]|nr:T9SS type A sorting domain-containing protein [Ignavibacteria bacterium]HRJ98886.1 T9SS type A sorting domain-containing protein [Ignavibacteria bacterium]
MDQGELIIKNRFAEGTNNIKVRMYPLGAIFAGGTGVNNAYMNYTAYADPNDHPINYDFITGGEKILTPYNPNFQYDRSAFLRVDQDGVSNSQSCDFTVGYGIYQIDIYYYSDFEWILIKTFTINWLDSDYPYGPGQYGGIDPSNDIKVYVNSPTDVKVHYGGGQTEPYVNFDHDFHDLSLFNNDIKIWYQYHKDVYGNISTFSKIPNKNNFRTTDTVNFSLSTIFLDNWPFKGTNFPNNNISQPHLKPGALSVNLEIQNNHYAEINISTPFIIEDSAKLILKYSEVFENNARLYVQDSGRLFVRPAGELEIDKYGNVIIENGGRAILEQNSNVFFHERGEIIVKNGGSLINCGADFTNNNYACILVEQGGYYGPGQECNTSVTHKVDSGAFIVVNGGTLNIGDNSKIIFDGLTSFLKVNPNSEIKLGENASIEFKNGARLIADGSTFSGIDSSKLWSGILLDNSGIDSISNCTFRHAKIGLRFTNNAQANYNDRIIKNCNFFIPAGGNHQGILAENCYRASIENNIFNMPSSGSNYIIGLFLNNFTIGGGIEASGSGPEVETPYIVNIVNNIFNNGTASFIAANYTTNFIPFNIFRNTFNYASSVNMYLLKAGGSVKNNNFTSMSVPNSVHLFNSNTDFYNNVIASNGVSLQLSGYSYPNMQPLRTSGSLKWNGGKNALSSISGDNVHLNYSGNLFTDYGHNSFLAAAENYHIYGWIDSSVHRYFTRENCWFNTGTPSVYLTRKGDSASIPFTYYNNGYDCNTSIDPTGIETNDMGYGITDTTYISADNTGTSLTGDEVLYAQAQEFLTNKLYYDAVTNFKSLIDNYPSSKHIETSLYDIYACYNGLDTSALVTYRDDLYSNLKIYLEEKINSGLYSAEFNDIAFDDILMCLTITENYESAMNGYEMIAYFNPDPDIRLTASWNYAEIEAIINSAAGGGIRQMEGKTESIVERENIEINRINKIIKEDPLLSKIKKSYEESGKSADLKKSDRSYKNKNNEKNYSGRYSKELMTDNETKLLKFSKARRNLMELKYLNKEELCLRKLEDLILLNEQNDFSRSNDSNINNPLKYVLNQNYPNPFNPSTKIAYSNPVSGNVTIKIFDITGREIKSLINEFRNAGSYEVEFDGSRLASGVYYYKLETNNFSETKKMILIK